MSFTNFSRILPVTTILVALYRKKQEFPVLEMLLLYFRIGNEIPLEMAECSFQHLKCTLKSVTFS